MPRLEMTPSVRAFKRDLETIEEWSIGDGFYGLLRFAQVRWEDFDHSYFSLTSNPLHGQDIVCKLGTANWSRNNKLVSALIENKHFLAFCWVSTQCGGYYEFRIPAAMVHPAQGEADAIAQG